MYVLQLIDIYLLYYYMLHIKEICYFFLINCWPLIALKMVFHPSSISDYLKYCYNPVIKDFASFDDMTGTSVSSFSS